MSGSVQRIGHYRTLLDHMEFGPENGPVQEIANDLNVGADPGPGSYEPSDGWTSLSDATL